MGPKPVTISKGAFAFCRWSMAVLMWTGALMKWPWFVAFCATVMLVNAIVTVRRAPLVMLYTWTIDRIWPSKPDVVDERGMRAAHFVAFLMMSIGLILVFNAPNDIGWKFLYVVCVFKTAGAIGYCPVSRGFTCLLNGNGDCCKFLRRSRG